MQVSQNALSLALCWCLASVVSTANAPPNPGLQHNRLGKLEPKPGEFLNCGKMKDNRLGMHHQKFIKLQN